MTAYILLITQQGPWDQDKFEQLLTEWIVTCDQPFSEVEQPEFVKLLNYTHHATTSQLKIPQRKSIKRQVMKMGEETIKGVCEKFSVLLFALSLSILLLTAEKETQRQSQPIAGRMDIQQSVCILGYSCTLCDQ